MLYYLVRSKSLYKSYGILNIYILLKFYVKIIKNKFDLNN